MKQEERTMLFPQQTEQKAIAAIVACNALSIGYGLSLSAEQAKAIEEVRELSLIQTGRVEFDGGILQKLITAFCDSPYIEQTAYADTLSALVSGFYDYKNETCDLVPDDILIAFMKQAFDGECQGSIDALLTTALPAFSDRVRAGGKTAYDEDDEDGEDADE